MRRVLGYAKHLRYLVDHADGKLKAPDVEQRHRRSILAAIRHLDRAQEEGPETYQLVVQRHGFVQAELRQVLSKYNSRLLQSMRTNWEQCRELKAAELAAARKSKDYASLNAHRFNLVRRRKPKQ